MCSVILWLTKHVTSQKTHPCIKGPWLNDLCQHEQQYNTNSDQDEEALQDKLESPLVLNLGELNRLKGKRMRERSNEEDTAHLEDQEHSGDAQADEGAPKKAGHPHQTELEGCNHKGRGVSKGLEA